jgi:simple sugar transport system ATP-binding protein
LLAFKRHEASIARNPKSIPAASHPIRPVRIRRGRIFICLEAPMTKTRSDPPKKARLPESGRSEARRGTVSPPAALEMVHIEKYFGSVCALKDINLTVGKNEIVGLIGDNGAGKSTMVKILTGVFPPSSGGLSIAGQTVNFRAYNVKRAHALGLETVYQDKSLGEKQPLWRNFFIGREICYPLGFINVKKEKEIANEIMVKTIGFRGVGITVDSNVTKLSGGERQGVAIGRAMHFEAELIILDEPTVALSLKEVRKVLNFVHKIKSAGKACIYISHNLADVYEISDRFVIMDRGKIVADKPKREISLKALDDFMLEYAHGRMDEVSS